MAAIVDLATATASDRAAISQLTATVKSLTADLITVNAKLVAALQPQRAIRGGRGERSRRRGRECGRGRGRGRERGRGRGRGRGASTGAGATTPTIVPTTSAGSATRTDNQYLEPPLHYCWKCGPRCRHNSAKCPAPTTGHIYTATKRGMQGRAEAQKLHRRGKAAIYNLGSLLNNHFSYTLVTPPVELSVAGSGCNSHVLPSTCPCNNKFAVVHGVKRVCMPNGETMLATHTALIPFPQLPLASRECSVFPALQQPLFSLGQFCDSGFTATLTSETVLLTQDGINTLAGTRDHINEL